MPSNSAYLNDPVFYIVEYMTLKNVSNQFYIVMKSIFYFVYQLFIHHELVLRKIKKHDLSFM
jgi:hypothetical protein